MKLQKITPKSYGIVTVTSTDKRNGKTEIVQHNLLLDDMIDNFFKNSSPIYVNEDLGRECYIMHNCYLGTSNTQPSRDQLGIQGTILSNTTNWQQVKHKVIEDHTICNAYKFTFAAGTGTGEVGEIALRANSETNLRVDENWVARVVFDPKINKTEYTELEVLWEIRVDFGTSEWSGTISNGQIDGSSIDYVITINDEQKKNILGIDQNNGSTALLGYFDSEEWTAITPEAKVYVGNSNSPTDITTDNAINIKGDIIAEIESRDITEYQTYVDGSREQTITLALKTSHANEDIYEVVLATTSFGFMRITFNPPLQKINTHRLYLRIPFALSQGGA